MITAEHSNMKISVESISSHIGLLDQDELDRYTNKTSELSRQLHNMIALSWFVRPEGDNTTCTIYNNKARKSVFCKPI